MEKYFKKSGRPRTKIKKYYSIKDSWVLYKNTTQFDSVDRKLYNEIIYGFMEYISNILIDKGELKLPERLGTLKIVGKKPNYKVTEDNKIKGLAIDWKTTRELWEEQDVKEGQYVYFMNEHTNNIRYKTIWYKQNVLIPMKEIYKFILCRKLKRTLAKSIKDGHEYLIKQ